MNSDGTFSLSTTNFSLCAFHKILTNILLLLPLLSTKQLLKTCVISKYTKLQYGRISQTARSIVDLWCPHQQLFCFSIIPQRLLNKLFQSHFIRKIMKCNKYFWNWSQTNTTEGDKYVEKACLPCTILPSKLHKKAFTDFPRYNSYMLTWSVFQRIKLLLSV